MKVYQPSGSFDATSKTFSLEIITTEIDPDKFKVTAYYNICTPNRYAMVAILQTYDQDATDFSNYPPDSKLNENNIPFSSLNNSYVVSGDRNIQNITSTDEITVYVHHGIGFDPTTNSDDNKYIQNYKLGIYMHLAAGSPPGKGEPGTMPG